MGKKINGVKIEYYKNTDKKGGCRVIASTIPGMYYEKVFLQITLVVVLMVIVYLRAVKKK